VIEHVVFSMASSAIEAAKKQNMAQR